MTTPLAELRSLADQIARGGDVRATADALRYIASLILSPPINLPGNLTIDANNANQYYGQTLVVPSANTITLAAGLPAGFNIALIPPASGSVSIASDGTVLLNGATTTIQRSATDIIFGVVWVAVDRFVVK